MDSGRSEDQEETKIGGGDYGNNQTNLAKMVGIEF
jgi:hypothetical protein